MENVMTNGFCELNEQDMMKTNGGVAPIIIIAAIGIGSVLGVTAGGYAYGAYLNRQAQLTNAKADALANGINLN